MNPSTINDYIIAKDTLINNSGRGHSFLEKLAISFASIKYLICSHLDLVPHSLVSNKGILCHAMVIVIKNSKHSSLPGAGE
jgi:hypothetical protein